MIWIIFVPFFLLSIIHFWKAFGKVATNLTSESWWHQCNVISPTIFSNMIKNRRGDGAGPPYPDADDSPTPERPGSKYITPLSLSLWPHPIQNRDPASREGWQYEEGQKYLYLGLQYKELVENNVKIAKKTFVKAKVLLLKVLKAMTNKLFMRATIMFHIWNTPGHGHGMKFGVMKCFMMINHKCKWS